MEGSRGQTACCWKEKGEVTDAQLYFAAGLPTAVALIGILVNVGYFISLNGRMTRLETRVDQLSDKIAALEVQSAVLKQGFDILLKKFDEARH
jgi:hypothetical protein